MKKIALRIKKLCSSKICVRNFFKSPCIDVIPAHKISTRVDMCYMQIIATSRCRAIACLTMLH